jgi:hypothetical protein
MKRVVYSIFLIGAAMILGRGAVALTFGSTMPEGPAVQAEQSLMNTPR